MIGSTIYYFVLIMGVGSEMKLLFCRNSNGFQRIFTHKSSQFYSHKVKKKKRQKSACGYFRPVFPSHNVINLNTICPIGRIFSFSIRNKCHNQFAVGSGIFKWARVQRYSCNSNEKHIRRKRKWCRIDNVGKTH